MSARPFPLDAPASRPKAALRLRYVVPLIVVACALVTLAGSYLLAIPEGRLIVLGTAVTLIMNRQGYVRNAFVGLYKDHQGAVTDVLFQAVQER